MMKVWGVTDVGLVRKENQDAFGICEATATGHTICVVCDGMGGAVGGSLASSVAVESFLQENQEVRVLSLYLRLLSQQFCLHR